MRTLKSGARTDLTVRSCCAKFHVGSLNNTGAKGDPIGQAHFLVDIVCKSDVVGPGTSCVGASSNNYSYGAVGAGPHAVIHGTLLDRHIS